MAGLSMQSKAVVLLLVNFVCLALGSLGRLFGLLYLNLRKKGI